MGLIYRLQLLQLGISKTLTATRTSLLSLLMTDQYEMVFIISPRV